ncbi:MAG: hypothetical protein ACFCVG_07690 [Kineosporiaceae bacterium]
MPTTAPADVDWQMVGRLVVPSHRAVGPRRADPVRRCFARSPVGAVFAAANLTALTTLPEAEAREAILDLTAETRGRELLAGTLATESPRRAEDTSLALAGFSVVSWTHDESSVDLAMLVSRSGAVAQYVSVVMTVTWEGGDWRLVASDTTGEPFTLRPLPSLVGYTRWAPR